MTKPLNIIFAGTPDFAARHLQALIESEHNVVAVYSQPDRPAGRGKKLQASAVKQLALQHNLIVMQPESLKSEQAHTELKALNADIMIVVAYGLILPQSILDTPRLGCLNVHGSLLPKWRGAAPIQRSIWAGDKETGVTVMQMDKGLDTGAMLLTESLPITALDTSATLYDKLAEIGPKALLKTLANLDKLEAVNQDDNLATYAKKLSKQEAKIDWLLNAQQLCRNIRSFNPWPMAYFELDAGPVKVWDAMLVEQASDQAKTQPGEIISADKNGILIACSEHALLITSLQLPGKKAMATQDVLNSRSDWFSPGTVLK